MNTEEVKTALEDNKVPFTADEMQAIQNVLNSRLGLQLTIDELFFS